jgi:hypothetical protein
MVRTRSGIAAVIAAASCLLLSAPSATAASGDIMVYTTDPGHPAAFGWFHPYGEAWGVCDDQADSRRAIAQLKDLTAGVQYGLVDDTGYDNTCARANVLFNITDGHRVALRVCLRNGALGAITSCSAWKYTTA